MKNIILLFFTSLIVSYAQDSKSINDSNTAIATLQNDYVKWKHYFDEEIFLSLDFTAIDENNQLISKKTFLEHLTEGNSIPVKQIAKEDTITYKLVPIAASSDSSIKASIVEKAFNELSNYSKEGKAFPSFSFKDLKGNLITNASMKNKVIVIKCWFIHCAICIKEFPEVNALAQKYKDRSDIQFISLAEDTPEQLKTFLARKPLQYAVVPNMKEYMNEDLQLNAFPTHFILDKEGTIVKVASNFKSLEMALEAIAKQ